MKQATFASLSCDAKKKRTRREVFLGDMDRLVPWAAPEALIEPHYPSSGRRGRPPMALSTMLRIHLMQQWYALSDPAMEDALYEIESMRRSAGIERNEGAFPDEATFRRRLEQRGLAQQRLKAVNAHLTDKGLLLRQGTIVDATIIAAPSSTRNRDQARDPAMRQTKNVEQWHFGMRAHIGVDSDSGLVHTVTATAANAADVGNRARMRARVKHPFRVIKRQFGYRMVRCRGLAKNAAHVLTLFALSNLWMKRRPYWQWQDKCARQPVKTPASRPWTAKCRR